MARKNDSLPVLRKRVKGVDQDPRPHLTMPSKLQVEAGRKQWRLQQEVRKVYPGATSRFRNSMMQIAYPDQSAEPNSYVYALFHGVMEKVYFHSWIVLVEAEADWKLGNVADLPAWQAAFKLTQGAKK